MSQSTNNRSAGLLVGILFLLLSLPLDWITITSPNPLDGKLPSFGASTATITGLNGKVSLLSIQLPIWLVVIFGLLSLLFLLANQRQITSLPRFSIFVFGAVSTYCVLLAFWLCVSQENFSIQLGPVLAAIGLALGFACGRSGLRPVTHSQSH